MIIVAVKNLPEIPLLIQKSHSDERDAKVVGRFEIITGKNTETSGIDGQRFAEAKLHAETGDSCQQSLLVVIMKPGSMRESIFAFLQLLL